MCVMEKEGNLPTVQNENVDQVRLCCVCEIYTLISYYLSGTARWEYDSQRVNSVHVIEHKLFVAGFSPRREMLKLCLIVIK